MVVRALLGLELESLNDHSIHVTDPGFFQLNWAKEWSWAIPLSTKLIILPIHHGDYQHWSISAILVPEGRIRHFDSAPIGDDNAIVYKIKQLLEIAAERNPQLKQTWKYDAEEVLGQTRVECGIHAIENAKAIMRGHPLPITINAAELRLHYAKQISDAVIQLWSYAEDLYAEDNLSSSESDVEEMEQNAPAEGSLVSTPRSCISYKVYHGIPY